MANEKLPAPSVERLGNRCRTFHYIRLAVMHDLMGCRDVIMRMHDVVGHVLYADFSMHSGRSGTSLRMAQLGEKI